MKRKLKIAGLGALLVSVFSSIVNSALSGGTGFGIAVIICFFVAVFSLAGIFVVNLKQYRLLKMHFESVKMPVPARKPKKNHHPELEAEEDE